MRVNRGWVLLLAVVMTTALVVPGIVLAQSRRGRGFRATVGSVPYDGRFTFTRVYFGGSGGGGFGFGRGSSAWNHDYPDADINLGLILENLTAMTVRPQETNILDLEDPEIFRQPILYMWEPGYWTVTEAGAANLGVYLDKGGFIIFDDFEVDFWINMEEQFRRAVPEARWVQLDTSHPVFHSFFDMNTVDIPHPDYGDIVPAYYGVFEANDPSRRLVALAYHNNDVAEYWEWSGTGMFGIDTTNDAYKLGVNSIVYALTH